MLCLGLTTGQLSKQGRKARLARARILALLWVCVDDCNGELCKVVPSREQLLMICHTEEEGEVISYVTAMWVHQDVPAVLPAFRQLS